MEVVSRLLPVLALLSVFGFGCGSQTADTKKEAPKALYEEPTGVGMPKDYKKIMAPAKQPAAK